nr:NDP-hexose 2,3-dehydratase [Micromonospora sp.]
MAGANAAVTDATRSAETLEWLADRARANRCSVTRIPFAEMDAWSFQPGTGNLVHDSGRFFAVEGIRVDDDNGPRATQPILNQPEIGILGLLTQKAGGVRRYLVQAKMEPGNVNTMQLAPTVQATRSNYMRVHGGRSTVYLEHFRGSGRGRPLVDVLQSEQGSWFLRKRNRNMVVETAGDVPDHEDFRWMTRDEIHELLSVDNLAGMDIRTVLSCLPAERPRTAPYDEFTEALRRSYDRAAPARCTPAEILSWFTEARSRCDWRVTSIPLRDVPSWTVGADEVAEEGGRRFRITGRRVVAERREVTSWAQPLLEPLSIGLAAFLARPIDGVLHVLVRARPQAGLPDLVEIGPTVQTQADEPDPADPLAAEARTENPGRVRFDTVLSEEGGRFFHARTRYRLIDVGRDFPLDVPPDHCWLTVRQLMDLVRHKHYLNVEARTLLACTHSL